MPFHVWSRLHAAMRILLVEISFNCWTWHHRQLKETAEQRYAGPEVERIHSILADYFGNLAHSVKTDAGVNYQPLIFNPDQTNLWADYDALSAAGVQSDPVQINYRR